VKSSLRRELDVFARRFVTRSIWQPAELLDVGRRHLGDCGVAVGPGLLFIGVAFAIEAVNPFLHHIDPHLSAKC
jgi:hypothetical protein